MKKQRCPESVELVRDFRCEEGDHPTDIVQTGHLYNSYKVKFKVLLTVQLDVSCDGN
jgi:hypothetical protein